MIPVIYHAIVAILSLRDTRFGCFMKTRKPILLLSAFWLVSVGAVAVCSVPVFRYALERWPSDDYVAVVFHRGALSGASTHLIEDVAPDSRASLEIANIELRAVDLDGDPEEGMLEVWEEAGGDRTPWMVVTYPESGGNNDVIWSGPISKENVEAVMDSPKRQELARRILDGDSAVWLFLESGDEAKDEIAFETLVARTSVLEEKLKLPEIKQEDIAAGLLNIEKSQLKLKFSVLRVSREDDAESAFVRMLLASEDDLDDLNEPMVFPVYGRGRFMPAMVGKGITDENITRDAVFLVGPCSCEVKRQNPGKDLLVAVDWESQIQMQIDIDRELPPLTGVGMVDAGPAEKDVSARKGDVSMGDMVQGTVSPPPDLASTSSKFWIFLGMLALGSYLVGAWLFTRRA